MKWAYRLGIAGVIWAILTFVLFAPNDCATNDLCGFGFSFLNYPLFIIFGDGAPGFGNLLVETIIADAATGLAIGVILDFILRKTEA
jgi:hypothetical protein